MHASPIRLGFTVVHALRTVCLAALFVVTAAVAFSAETKGVFTAVTYNVAGLPEGISSGHPAASTPYIGQRLANYAYIHVQEDFNYHAALHANDKHPFRTTTSGGAGFGSGLNMLSNFPLSDLKRVTWSRRSGADALTPKGFAFHRVRLSEDVFVDFYNLHTNAGVSASDRAARASNISQLSAFITANSEGNAVIVMGDTNTRYTRASDNIRLLTSANALTDVWIQLIRNGDVPALGSAPLVAGPTAKNNDEVVDKIFYRSSSLITLTPSNYRLDDPAFYHPVTHVALSDHWPVFVTFSWKLTGAGHAGAFSR